MLDDESSPWWTSDRALREGRGNVADGLFAIAEALSDLTNAVHRLGNADASTPYGGLEALGMVIRDAADRIAGACSQDDEA